MRQTVELVARYVDSTWTLKSFSCWEEFDGGEHASTLGAAIAGLDAASRLLESADWAAQGDGVREQLLGRFLRGGRFMRGRSDERVDGSLLWLGTPFRVLPIDDPRIEATVEAVRHDLHRPGGGVYRYRGDSYYGGGEWILLACSLAWYELGRGNADAAQQLRDWVRAQALPNGDLPEQVTGRAQWPEMYAPWLERWGPVATPLLWSHAMYLIVESAAGA
jgi:isomaltose glucohydrolase